MALVVGFWRTASFCSGVTPRPPVYFGYQAAQVAADPFYVLFSLTNWTGTVADPLFASSSVKIPLINAASAPLLQSLLWQLLSAKKHLIRHAIAAFQGRDIAKVIEEPDVLWEVCTACFEDPGAGDITWILDGLDECEMPGRQQLLRLIVSYFSANKVKSNQHVRVLLTSRLDVPILDILDHAIPNIHLDNHHSHTHRDVELLDRERVSHLQSNGRCSEESAIELQGRLLKNAHRTFLWVPLVLDSFDRSLESSHEAFKDISHSLPDALTALYERITNQLPTKEREKSRQMFQLVVFSAKALTLEELNLAWTIRPCDISENDVIERLDNNIRRTVVGLCGSLVRIVKNRVFLVHTSARDFLVNQSVAAGIQGRPWYSLDPPRAHLSIAHVCAQYLLLEEIRGFLLGIDDLTKDKPGADGTCTESPGPDDSETVPPALEDSSDDAVLDLPAARIKEFVDKHGLFVYASRFWPRHFREAQSLPILERSSIFEPAFEIYFATRTVDEL